MRTTDTSPMNVASEQHASDEKKVGHHPATGGSKPKTCVTDGMASEKGTKEEKSEGAQEKKYAPLKEGSWVNHTRIACV